MKRHWAIRIWDDGQYFDLWHLNHFLAGILLALAGIFIGLSFPVNIAVAFCIMMAWEIFEIIEGISETIFNRYFDVIFGLIAFILVYLFHLSNSEFKVLFIVVLLLWLVVELWGYYAYKARGGNKSRSN